ncbi:MAG: hypothetical protein HUU43_17000, partial [Ignavibacteriaceae bacterium]|nr:hypothetical protein [Ignavibacteriaceae bacterium]
RQDFQLIKTTEGNNYVQSLTETDRNTVLISHGTAVFEYSSSEGSVKELYRSVNSNILFAELRNNTLYILNDIEQLLIINSNGDAKTISLYPNGIIPSSLLPDSKGNLWVIFYNSSEILKIDKDFKFSRYLASGNPELSPGKILEDENGDIYITGFSKDAILKRFDSTVQKFIPVQSGSDKSRLKVNDAEKYQNNWYFATDSGLYKLSGTTLTRLLSSDLNNSNFTALEFDANGSIWLGSNRGFYRIEHEKFILGFDESNGLPARTINLNSLVVQGTEVFAGTPNGAARFTSSVLSINTKKPFVILRERFTGDLFAWSDNEVNIYEGESLILSALSTSYPNKNMIYELVINGENFLREKHFNSETEFGYGLEPGNYRIYVRAKKNGNYNWSESFAFTLNIKGRWYSSWLALLLYILTAFGLIYAGSYVVSLRVRKENQKLESLVKARTEEIRHKNEILESQNSKIEKQYAELQILLEQLKESNLTKNKLFSVISHDLKNPFVALLGISELLLEDFDDLNDDEKKEFIKKINNSGRITFSLVENLLNWARSQTNRISINSSHFNLRSLYDEESAILSNLAAEKNVRILNNTDENLIVFADRHMMSSVARNILQNAIKYSPLNGKIHINSFSDTNFAGVSVTDEGSGMTEEQVSKLFSLEKKTVTVGTFNEKGTGLGLLICKEFTEANGGEIKVESAPGSGSTFTITLPMKKSEE